jgi:bifunctional non-homologous end joining protein LigD
LVKHRINNGQEFVIGGYVPNNPLDSIIVGYYDDEKLIYVAKVRNGLVQNTRRAVASKFTGVRHSKFAGLRNDKDARRVARDK